MDFKLSEEQTLLADSMERFVRNEYDFDTRRKSLGSDTGFSQARWRDFVELGWTAIPFAEQDEGFGDGAAELMLIMQAFGHGLVVEPYLASIVLAGTVLGEAGSAAQKQRWLQPLMQGSSMGALAFVEPQARYELSNVCTTAQRVAEGYVIDGFKSVVLNGASADILLVPARTSGAQRDGQGVSIFAIDANAKGITRRDYATIDGFRASDIRFEQVLVESQALIGQPNAGSAIIQKSIDRATLAVCAEALGVMEQLVSKTIEYAKTHKQFGVPIGSFQALQHRLVDMFMNLEQTRSLLYRAVMQLDADVPDAVRTLAALKYYVGTTGRRIGEEAVQMHGGMGVSDELDIGHFFKRLIMIDTLFGNADYQLQRFIGAPR